VFDKSVLRRIFGYQREELTLEWRKLHIDELNCLYCSPHNFRMIKSRRMRWEGNVARMGDSRHIYSVLVVKLERKRPLE
jgi:hypothetical protein